MSLYFVQKDFSFSQDITGNLANGGLTTILPGMHQCRKWLLQNHFIRFKVGQNVINNNKLSQSIIV